MAALGAIGTFNSDLLSGKNQLIAFDVAAARNITTYPVTMTSRLDLFAVIDYADRAFYRGFVKNSANVGIARRVCAFDEIALQVVDSLISSAADGSFTLRPLNTFNKISVFHIPEAADARNGVILSLLTPVAS